MKARVQHQLPGVEMTEVEVHMVPYGRLPTGSTIWSRRWL